MRGEISCYNFFLDLLKGKDEWNRGEKDDLHTALQYHLHQRCLQLNFALYMFFIKYLISCHKSGVGISLWLQFGNFHRNLRWI